jgi:hypothetical protein
MPEPERAGGPTRSALSGEQFANSAVFPSLHGVAVTAPRERGP